VAIEIERFEEDSSADLLRIDALIHVERSSQKGIVIGKGGAKLKEIGSAARQELERIFGRRVFLQTHVRVQEDWSKDARALDRFGYRKPGKE
jgi:GTP-binding protein Era